MNDSCIWVSGGSNILLGDLLVIGGTVFFALSNVGQVGQCASTSFSKSLSQISINQSNFEPVTYEWVNSGYFISNRSNRWNLKRLNEPIRHLKFVKRENMPLII